MSFLHLPASSLFPSSYPTIGAHLNFSEGVAFVEAGLSSENHSADFFNNRWLNVTSVDLLRQLAEKPDSISFAVAMQKTILLVFTVITIEQNITSCH